MPDTTLAELLERNVRHVESLETDHFSAVQTAQSPAIVSVCCSDSRVSQEGMWAVNEPGWLFTVGNIGNQVTDDYDGEEVLCGDLLYPIQFTDTKLVAVVGHTGCGAITAALERVQSDEPKPFAHGIEKRVRSLVPTVESGLADPRINADRNVSLVNQLVEYNVDRQIDCIRESDSVPDSETVVGFVYDFQGVYSDARGMCYLVNYDGETSIEKLRATVPDGFDNHVQRLLTPA